MGCCYLLSNAIAPRANRAGVQGKKHRTPKEGEAWDTLCLGFIVEVTTLSEGRWLCTVTSAVVIRPSLRTQCSVTRAFAELSA